MNNIMIGNDMTVYIGEHYCLTHKECMSFIDEGYEVRRLSISSLVRDIMVYND